MTRYHPTMQVWACEEKDTINRMIVTRATFWNRDMVSQLVRPNRVKRFALSVSRLPNVLRAAIIVFISEQKAHQKFMRAFTHYI
jgi:hypothetical protein